MGIRSDNFINIQGWMVTELELKGNELLIYAVIHGITQDGESRYSGGLAYLAEWIRSSKQTVISNLKSLCEKGLIVKEEKYINNVKYCEYFVPARGRDSDGQCGGSGTGADVQDGQSERYSKNLNGQSEQYSKNLNGVFKNFERGGQKILPNNKYNNKINNKQTSSTSETSSDVSANADAPVGKEVGDPVESVGDGMDKPQDTGGGGNCSDVQKVIEEWNTLSGYGINQISRINSGSKRYKMLKARLQQYGLDNVLKAIDNIKRSKFLQGSGSKGWFITFDWFVRPNCFPKVLEGNYVDRMNGGGDGDGCAGGNDSKYQQAAGGKTEKGYDPSECYGMDWRDIPEFEGWD